MRVCVRACMCMCMRVGWGDCFTRSLCSRPMQQLVVALMSFWAGRPACSLLPVASRRVALYMNTKKGDAFTGVMNTSIVTGEQSGLDCGAGKDWGRMG